jgi:outer membrane receptor protein involved in Fe transport
LTLHRITAAALVAITQIGTAYAQSTPEAPASAATGAAPAAEPAVTPAAPAAVPAATPAAPAATPAPADGLKLDAIVVTGTSTARSKMKQSVSVSTMGAEQIQNSAATSAAEVLRSVPGVRAESSGGEGNANLGVRGLPMSDGGGRYVQLQEDGLPVVLFGDMSFATADQFLRADYSVSALDAVRGGSASTLSTNSPGAIVNFRSKTGKEPGGAVGVSFGVGHREQRLDFDWGGAIGDRLYAHVGGFQRMGQGPRNTDLTAENGGQIKASFTKEFDNGYLRLNLKHLDDHTPTYLPVPVGLNGNTITQIPGVDPRNAYFINSNFPIDTVVDRNGNKVVTNPADGLHVQVDSVGVEGQFKLANGWTVTDKFRKTSIGGRFTGVFPAGSQPAGYTGTDPVFSAHLFNTSLDDMGNVFNDLRAQKEIQLDKSQKLTVTGGLFSGVQHIAQTWYWNRYNIGLTGNGAALYDNAGNPTTLPVGDATTTWGGCCFRAIDVQVTALAPYAAATWENGPLSIDASIRHDSQEGTGWQRFGDTTGNWKPGVDKVSFSSSANSYSLGANYEHSRNLASFARVSHGVSWKSPDRTIWDTRAAAGLDPYPVNEVDQFEAGVKYRKAGFSSFLTAFLARTKEGAGYEVTSQTVKKNAYESKGLEAEMAYSLGEFRIAGGATLTNARITSGGNDGNVPRRQANLIYQIAPSYSMDSLEFGAAIIGTTQSYAQDDNQVVLPAYTVVNAYANWEAQKNAVVSFGVNNLFDTIGYTEAEGQNNLGTNPQYVARSINGRTARVTFKLMF